MDWLKEFPILTHLIFLNHAGVAPISCRAADAMKLYASQAADHAYVQSGWYAKAAKVKKQIAQLIHARGSHEIAYVGNTSTGLSLVAKGFPFKAGDQVVISNVEYPANRYPWIDLQRLGVEIIEVPQLTDGRIAVEDVVNAVTNQTRMVAISHVQYASGFCIDLKPISETVHRAGGYLCVDGIQSVGVLPVDVAAMGIDFLAADSHKWMLGPEGCGFLYCHEELIEMLHPNVVGWMNMVNAHDYGNYRFEFEKDARRFEPGSYNLAGIHAMGASVELLLDYGPNQVWHRVEALTDQLCEGLTHKNYHIFSPRQKGEKSGIVIFEAAKNKPDAAEIVRQLAEQGIVIVMREGKLRASPHFYNTHDQIANLLAALP